MGAESSLNWSGGGLTSALNAVGGTIDVELQSPILYTHWTELAVNLSLPLR